MEFIIRTEKGFFTGFDEEKVTYVVETHPYAQACAIHYDTIEEAQEDADIFGGTVVNINDLNSTLKNEKSQMNNNLFEYKDEEFNAKNLDAAMTRFLDEAWGVHYVKHLESKGADTKKIGAIKDIKDIEYEHFYVLKQELENGDILNFEVWLNDDGTYEGLAQEVIA